MVKTGSGSVILVYSCPESAPIRQKMTYSTAKATVVAELNALGVSLDRVTEIRQVRHYYFNSTCGKYIDVHSSYLYHVCPHVIYIYIYHVIHIYIYISCTHSIMSILVFCFNIGSGYCWCPGA